MKVFYLTYLYMSFEQFHLYCRYSSLINLALLYAQIDETLLNDVNF